MAYTPSSNPVIAYVQPTSSARIKQWIYRATDPIATVATDGYFSDGFDRGMTVGDVLWHLDSGANELTIRQVITSTATGGVSTALFVDPNSSLSRAHRLVTAAGAVTVDADDDDIVEIKKTVGAATTVQLPLSSARTTGRSIKIVDGKGDASSNALTITPAGADTIVGLTTYVINFDRGSVEMLPNFNGDGWLI